MHLSRRVSHAVAGLIFATAALAGSARADSGGADAETKPKWEIGLGAGWAISPHYPAAAQSTVIFAAAPYFIYRWKRVKIGEGGLVSGRLFRNDRLDLTLSIGGALPAKSKDDRARAGMPNLDTLAEVGPQLKITLAKREKRYEWQLKLPLRAVVSTDFHSIDYRGVVFKPRLSYKREGLAGGGLEASVSAGPIFASDLLMDYFYDVPPAYATPTRAAYESNGGYMGSTLNFGLKYKVNDRLRLVAGAQAAYWGGSANEDSPLFRDRTTYSIGAGFVWKIWVSDERVPR